ncbi:ROK family protein [Leifsonia sp. NPDC058292]|uniref:ROK family transcriptional regulator n=1 Tax=Leifsonia sp. NPDC058292 TaxID=3346428 RepID=UPI0036DC45BE
MVNPKPDLGGATSRGVVLDLIRSRGPISRVQLATSTGFTQATISNVVRQLTEDNLVIESGEREYTGGKPRVMLTINPRARYAVGIQLGADSTTYVVIDVSGAVVGRVRARGVRDDEPDEVVPMLAARATGLLGTLDIPMGLVVGVGVAAPGPLDLDAGSIVGAPTMSGWLGFPIRAAVGEAMGLPAVLDNDATSAGVGEFWGGGIAESVAHCTVYMGAGIGAGIVIGGSVYRGATSNTGEIGQLRASVAPGSEPRTVEEVAGPRAVAQAARDALAAGRASSIEFDDADDPFAVFSAVAVAASHGDALARQLIGDSAQCLADAVLALADILDLDSIALAGPSFAVAGPIYLQAIQDRLEHEFSARARHSVRVALSHHVVDAAAVGVATLVLQRELAPRSFGPSTFVRA